MEVPVKIASDVIDFLPKVIKCMWKEAQESKDNQVDYRDGSHQE